MRVEETELGSLEDSQTHPSTSGSNRSASYRQLPEPRCERTYVECPTTKVDRISIPAQSGYQICKGNWILTPKTDAQVSATKMECDNSNLMAIATKIRQQRK